MGQYYNILQQQPSLVHQFYNEASTMMRIDGGASEAATGMMVMLICASIFLLLIFFLWSPELRMVL